MKEKNNFARVLEYLRDHNMIRNQKELAKRLNTTETTITRNKQGNVRHPDSETLHRFNVIFGDIINIDYLIGESDVMLVADLPANKKITTSVNPCKQGCPSNCASLIQVTIEAKDEAIMALKQEIAAKDEIIDYLKKQVLKLQASYVKEETYRNIPAGTVDEKSENHNSA